MIVLTIINSLAILYILFGKYFKVSAAKTFRKNTVVGYWIWYKHSGLFYIPIRNEGKLNTKEDIDYMINLNNQAKLQTLRATFSWLKTKKEVDEFEKNYSVVDKEIVENLVIGFEAKSN